MKTRLTSEEVYDEAASWAARVDAGPLSPEEQAALEAWLAADMRHVGALAQSSALLVPVHGPAAMQPAAPAAPREPAGPSRRLLIGGSIAAGLAAVAGVAQYVARILGEERYRTQIGEMRVIPLSDGSVVSLNTNSEIVVRYSRSRRYIQLLQGEALFDVAKDKQRPFIVQTGATQVRAVGTSFNVKALPNQPVQVLVREGVVEIKRPDVPVAPIVLVAMNSRAIAPQDAPIVAKPVPTAEVGRELAWRVGRLAFHGETLSEAAAEFARYSDVRIRIDDPEIGNEKVTGLFVSADPVGFANAVAVSFDLRAEISDKQIRLVRQ
ncbi:MAG TPA: FecR domain-containing protein [Rhizomicrobium sp.]|nr:FecR domain-containing protein [Rhizomicrobium sp.]